MYLSLQDIMYSYNDGFRATLMALSSKRSVDTIGEHAYMSVFLYAHIAVTEYLRFWMFKRRIVMSGAESFYEMLTPFERIPNIRYAYDELEQEHPWIIDNAEAIYEIFYEFNWDCVAANLALIDDLLECALECYNLDVDNFTYVNGKPFVATALISSQTVEYNLINIPVGKETI